MSDAFVAVDLGATSGRVMLGIVHPADGLAGGDGEGTRVELVEAARFPNGPVAVPRADGASQDLRWDVLGLWRGITDGLRAAAREAAARDAVVQGIGVDSWAVDYGLLDADGVLVGSPRCYRDPAVLGAADEVYAEIPGVEQYAVNGLQHLPFTTVFQLAAGRRESAWGAAHGMLLVPDLITCWLTGRQVAEVTNASTTGLLDVSARTWSQVLLTRLGEAFDELSGLRGMLPDLVEPGTVVGPLLPAIAEAAGLGPVPVVAVASHDTASAVAAIPLDAEPDPHADPHAERRGGVRARGAERTAPRHASAYISSGTWSLVGLELDAPVLTEASRSANFTNELGVDGTVRYLRNVMGLWVLDECVRAWRRHGADVDLDALLAAAADEPGGRCVIDVDGDEFLAPGDMPARFRAVAAADGQVVPATRPALVRAVLDSLAAAYARAVRTAGDLAGVEITAVHVAGGGSRNALLCRLTAEATGLPVVAGPVEASALGNVLVQARTAGALGSLEQVGLAELRAVVVQSEPLTRYVPGR